MYFLSGNSDQKYKFFLIVDKDGIGTGFRGLLLGRIENSSTKSNSDTQAEMLSRSILIRYWFSQKKND